MTSLHRQSQSGERTLNQRAVTRWPRVRGVSRPRGPEVLEEDVRGW